MAPFFPDKFAAFRQIFAKDVFDRTGARHLADEDVLPAGRAARAAVVRGQGGVAARHLLDTSVPLSEWMSRIENSFRRHHERVAWIDELSALIVRYRLGRNPMASLAHGDYAGQCAPSRTRSLGAVSVLQEQKRLQAVRKSGPDVRAMRDRQVSDLATVPEYDALRQTVGVPMALFNTSVPSNATMFAFHLSRVAVRFYRALVQILFHNNIYERDAPLSLSPDMRRRLDGLLGCMEEDLRRLPADLRGPASADSAKSRGALLQHVAAVKLALRAFDDHLTVRRVWKTDFRFKDMPDVSSNALFFIYYALDNCEAADTVYAEHRGHWMPAHYRVNAALRHVEEFASEFGCVANSKMSAAAHLCSVVKKH
ncbi:hypothetical protein HPB48_015306 [Haemaphysalis longicornis]|uniref:Peptidase M13 C-terminal domain-containing protein n=1 Tax=Haemaphysalis longicornis TaxID=44386 RepID=A0A9J6GJJ0_HAELO|nr:hypothetical protein HPB48_015306 [Haemaphysalis longicornis]